MNHVSTRDARNHLAELIDDAQHRPVVINRHGQPVAVMVSAREYENIQRHLLRARLDNAAAELDAGKGIRQSASAIVEEHIENPSD